MPGWYQYQISFAGDAGLSLDVGLFLVEKDHDKGVDITGGDRHRRRRIEDDLASELVYRQAVAHRDLVGSRQHRKTVNDAGGMRPPVVASTHRQVIALFVVEVLLTKKLAVEIVKPLDCHRGVS